MPRYKTPVKRTCEKCQNFRILGGRFGVCDKGEHPSKQELCTLFRRVAKKASILLLFVLFGCSPRVITVPEVHTEYIVRTDSFVQRDSVYVNDSVIIREKGDTVFVERFNKLFQDRWRDRVVRDTMIVRDSVTTVVEVEKELTWWQRQKQDFGELAMFLVVGLLILLFVRKKMA